MPLGYSYMIYKSHISEIKFRLMVLPLTLDMGYLLGMGFKKDCQLGSFNTIKTFFTFFFILLEMKNKNEKDAVFGWEVWFTHWLTNYLMTFDEVWDHLQGQHSFPSFAQAYYLPSYQQITRSKINPVKGGGSDLCLAIERIYL